MLCRVHNLALPVANLLGAVFRNSDLHGVLCTTAQRLTAEAPGAAALHGPLLLCRALRVASLQHASSSGQKLCDQTSTVCCAAAHSRGSRFCCCAWHWEQPACNMQAAQHKSSASRCPRRAVHHCAVAHSRGPWCSCFAWHLSVCSCIVYPQSMCSATRTSTAFCAPLGSGPQQKLQVQLLCVALGDACILPSGASLHALRGKCAAFLMCTASSCDNCTQGLI